MIQDLKNWVWKLSLQEERYFASILLSNAQKMMNSNKFPKNDKKHNMETRNENVFKVDFANTSRLQKSPIIFMQGLLNKIEPKET